MASNADRIGVGVYLIRRCRHRSTSRRHHVIHRKCFDDRKRPTTDIEVTVKPQEQRQQRRS